MLRQCVECSEFKDLDGVGKPQFKRTVAEPVCLDCAEKKRYNIWLASQERVCVVCTRLLRASAFSKAQYKTTNASPTCTVCAEEARRLDYVATGMPSNQLLLRWQSVRAAEILVKHQRVCNT